MAGGCPAPTRSPSCTARLSLKRPRSLSPLPRGPPLASGLPAAASHTRIPPPPPPLPPRSSRPYTRRATLLSRNRAQLSVPRLPRLRARPAPRPARAARREALKLRPGGVAMAGTGPPLGVEDEPLRTPAQDERRRDSGSQFAWRCLWW